MHCSGAPSPIPQTKYNSLAKISEINPSFPSFVLPGHKFLYFQKGDLQLLQSFSQFSSDLGAETKRRLARGRTLVEMLKQPNLSPLPLSKQLTILSVVGQGLLDFLELNSLGNYLICLSSVPQWILLFLPPRIIAKVLN